MWRSLMSLFFAVRRGRSAASRARPVTLTLEPFEARLVRSSAPLHVAGNQLADPAGDPVVLRGVNVISLEWRPDGHNVLQAADTALTDWQASLIRLPVNQDFWFGHDQYWTGGESGDGGASYRALVDQVVNLASAHNAYVMLDLHWSDMGQVGRNNGQHFLPDDLSTAFWQDAAPRYANNPTVLFDPYNEPHFANDHPTDADFALWQNGGTVHETGQFTGTYHSPGMQGLIDTIRATGAGNVIAPEGLNWGSNLYGVLTGHALSDPAGNLMYQSHLYPNKLADPQVASSVEAVGNGYPIYVGEWGSGGVIGQPDPNAAAANQQMLGYLDGHANFSWTAWALTADIHYYNLLAAWGGAPATSDYGVYVKADLASHAAGQTLTSIVVSPGSASLDAGGSQQFAAVGLDQFGNPLTVQPAFTWSVDGDGSIDPTGLYQAPDGPGTATVRATSGTVSGTATVTIDAGLNVTASFADVNDWGSGFTGYVTLTNRGGSDVHGWTLEFEFTGNIYTIWDARIVSHSGSHYVLENVSWDPDLLAGRSLDFGFNTDWADPPVAPAHFVLNGTPISGLAPNISASFADVNDWGSGFTGNITLTNHSGTDVDGWTLEFDFTGAISDTWNGWVVTHSGNHYVLRSVDWSRSIPDGQSLVIGFNADWADPQAGPTNFVLNGSPITG